MNTISIYGKPSYPYDYIKSSLLSLIEDAQLNIQLKEIQNTDGFIADHIEHIPAISYKGEVKSYKNSDLLEFSKTLKDWILKNEDYGALKRILVPIDYSKCSENALAYAKSMSHNKSYHINVQHSYFPSPVIADTQAYVNQELERIQREQFTKYVQTINGDWIGENNNHEIAMGSKFSIGFASDTIIEDSKRIDEGFIVMGSTGDSGLQKRVFGSVSTKVAQQAACPVLIIPQGSSYLGFRNVLYCCNDLSLDSNMVSSVVNFLRGQDTLIHLTHFGQDYAYNSSALKRVWNEFYKRDKIQYSQFDEKINKKLIKDFCQVYQIDLIIIARPKRGTIQSILHKSFTKEMTIFSEIPLLILNKQ